MQPSLRIHRTLSASERAAQLAADERPLPRCLEPATARQKTIERVRFDERQFRFALNEDAMATEKLAEGIRSFVAHALELEALVGC